MATPSSVAGVVPPATAPPPPHPPPPPPPPGNPAFKYIGLPNLRAKIPSKPWLVFIGLVSTWTGLMVYDRREKKRIQAHWCQQVSHLAQQPLPTDLLARKITVFLSAPPGDSLSVSREYFNEYIKPVLTAAALDFDMVEGRRIGEIRWKTAERIRRRRRGEAETETLAPVEQMRSTTGVKMEEGQGGVLIVGRNTWKEYIRGLHEGWLGPGDEFPEEEELVQREATPPPVSTLADAASTTQVDSNNTTDDKAPKTPPKSPIRPPFITPDSYASASIPESIPQPLSPIHPVPLPHILGFLNFPIRIGRYLQQRKVADRTGRETAAIALGLYEPFIAKEDIQSAMINEEAEWPKRYRKGELETPEDKEKGIVKERLWLEEVALDSRLVERMRRFRLPDAVPGPYSKDNNTGDVTTSRTNWI